MRRVATFDCTGTYRYSLTRAWDEGSGRVCFVLLNPSIADVERDDPTVRRCIGFARRWGFAEAEVVNLFALRTPSPAILRRASDPLGPDNDRYLVEAVARAALVVAGWGNHGAYRQRSEEVRSLLREVYCLGRTLMGEPKHPLYLPAHAERTILCP